MGRGKGQKGLRRSVSAVVQDIRSDARRLLHVLGRGRWRRRSACWRPDYRVECAACGHAFEAAPIYDKAGGWVRKPKAGESTRICPKAVFGFGDGI